MPPRFTAEQLPRLQAFLDVLPRDYHYAVELRDAAMFGPPTFDVLAGRGVDFVIMDTRGIHSSLSLTHAEARAQKPKLPVVVAATAQQPFVRIVPHEDGSPQIVEEWATQVARWIREGKAPYVFLHAPDDTFAPQNAYAFHASLAARAPVGDLPPWPGQPRQLGLF